MGASTDCKICLCRGYLWLARIAVLCDQVAGKTGKIIVFKLSLRFRAEFGHFRGGWKMVLDDLSNLLTSSHCSLNSYFKTFALVVTQQRRKIASTPILFTIGVHLLNRVEIWRLVRDHYLSKGVCTICIPFHIVIIWAICCDTASICTWI